MAYATAFSSPAPIEQTTNGIEKNKKSFTMYFAAIITNDKPLFFDKIADYMD